MYLKIKCGTSALGSGTDICYNDAGCVQAVNQPAKFFFLFFFYSIRFDVHISAAKLIISGLCTCALLSEAEPPQLPTAERSRFNEGKPRLGYQEGLAFRLYQIRIGFSDSSLGDSVLKSSLNSVRVPRVFLATPAGFSRRRFAVKRGTSSRMTRTDVALLCVSSSSTWSRVSTVLAPPQKRTRRRDLAF